MNNKLIKTSKIGVYYKILQDKDKAFFFTYKDVNDNNKKKWVKVGNYSDGIREINAFNLRAEQISKMKHGEDITVIANKKKIEMSRLIHTKRLHSFLTSPPSMRIA